MPFILAMLTIATRDIIAQESSLSRLPILAAQYRPNETSNGDRSIEGERKLQRTRLFRFVASYTGEFLCAVFSPSVSLSLSLVL